jgi:hypothetical protein
MLGDARLLFAIVSVTAKCRCHRDAAAQHIAAGFALNKKIHSL